MWPAHLWIWEVLEKQLQAKDNICPWSTQMTLMATTSFLPSEHRGLRKSARIHIFPSIIYLKHYILGIWYRGQKKRQRLSWHRISGDVGIWVERVWKKRTTVFYHNLEPIESRDVTHTPKHIKAFNLGNFKFSKAILNLCASG